MIENRPGILLDLDGTLIDSQPGILASCEAALRSLGHEPIEPLDIGSVIGPPIEDVMRYLLLPYGDTRVTEAVEGYRRDYWERGLKLSELYPAIRAQLSYIRQRGGRLFLATSKRTVFAKQILANHGLSDEFDGIYGSEPDGLIDHKPELIRHLLQHEGLTSDRCVMIGDRRFDIAGAHANNVRAVGVLWGYGSRQELESAGADRIIEQTSELADCALTIFNA
ncbi:HAD hydrolase-like protein [Ensifer sp. ENS06]|uniref:HAD hydrolase-like protein n=1 Tax=Ensifer sp. ENS06 TaxID=2769276 RepID=UPI000DDC2C1C|nr:HAD hydrolase-like protein [Ensifer sp. ENS06]MBD9624987.1 HAD hydrolase-like protein [Ensifer sp. ENS06]